MSRASLAARSLAARDLTPRGLPGRLPSGERLLWQGSPGARALMRHAFQIRAVALYFLAILAWCAVTLGHGASGQALRSALTHRAALAIVPVVLIAVYAWSIRRSTVYSITDRRVVISFGMALPVTFNIPFGKIDGVGLRRHPGGAGDITLQLTPGETLSYFVLWPHARPWRMKRTEPMLRCVPDAAAASSVLAAALAEYEVLSPARVVPLKPVRMRAGGVRAHAVAAE